jgi:MSHA biogenesis protein MshI
MRWPWKRKSSGDLLIVSWADQTLAYVLARPTAKGHTIVRMGLERQVGDNRDDLVRRLQGLGLKGMRTHIMLRPEQYQFLQIDAPSVPPEELRSAARYQVRELVDVHLDDITLDVMQLGDGNEKGQAHLFVVAAKSALLREAMVLADTLNWDVSVIDVQETAQRNLQSVLARHEGRLERATAALVLSDSKQAMLTISANDELYYTRRLELPEGFLAMTWSQSEAVHETDGYMPVSEYVPDYSVGGVVHGNDYSDARSSAAASTAGGQVDTERVQRFLVEVQRSLDLWDRTWSQLPLAGLRVFAGERSEELAAWLTREIGQTVGVLDVTPHFSGLKAADGVDATYCLPLVGVLLRTEGRKF